MIKRYLLRKKLKKLGIPERIDDFWPPFYRSFPEYAETFYTGKLATNKRSFNVDENIALIKKEGQLHYYTVIGWNTASGSDHIYDPTQYSFKYSHTE